MATLRAMFRLFDGYSSTINKIMNQTDKATKSILGASKKTDSFNESLKRTGSSASVASTGLTKLVGTIASFAAVKKAMDMTDTYTNTNARLAMVTNSLEEQKTLQADIFAAADRARGSYVDMANAASKLSMLAGDSFGSNLEAVGFAELLTKSLKVSGAGQAEQNSAFLQLTQAMTSGKLQGDEFRSIMENAPMVADAIATYMGKSKSELKDLSSEGLITADIIKGAMFSAADDINAKFDQMPMTFADAWQRIKNKSMESAGEIFEKLNNAMNSVSGQNLLNGAIAGMDYLLNRVNGLIDAIARGDPIVRVFFATAIIMAGLYAGKMLLAAGATMAAHWPLMLLVGGIAILLAAATSMGMTWSDVFGFLGGAVGGFGAIVFNVFAAVWNTIVTVANGIIVAFQGATAAVITSFYAMATIVLNILSKLAGAIDSVFGFNLASSVEKFKEGLGEKYLSTMEGMGDLANLGDLKLGYMNISDTAGTWSKAGASFGAGIDNWDFSMPFTAPSAGGAGGIDFSQFATASDPATVKGTGQGGAVKVENEEDIEWMRRLAEREYVARIAQNTLAPNIYVEFSGPITKEADTDSVMAHVNEQLKDIIATAPEGVPT